MVNFAAETQLKMPRQISNPAFRIALFLVAAAITSAGQTPSLRSNTQLVEIDTVATDSHGKPILDLRLKISSSLKTVSSVLSRIFHWRKLSGLDPKAVQQIRELAQKQKPGVYANFTAETAFVPPNGCTVLLIDWLNTPLELQTGAFKEMKNFIETVDLSKPLEIFSLDSSLHLVQSFTTDRQVLRNNIEKYGLHNTNLQPEKRASHNLDSELVDFRVSRSVQSLGRLLALCKGCKAAKA